MSTGYRYPFSVAYETAALFIANINPFCERVNVAGSLRRILTAHIGNPDIPDDITVGDIEVVAIPAFRERRINLFESEQVNRLWQRVTPPWYYAWLKKSDPPKPQAWGERYRKVELYPPGDIGEPIPCDIFTATPDNWGYILALRTGPAAWNKALVTPREKGGFLPPDIELHKGTVYRVGLYSREPLSMPEEADFFRALGLPYLAPHERTAEALMGLQAEALRSA